MDELEVVAGYLKLVNIPCMFDLGITPCDPKDQQLNLNIVDDITYHDVLKQDVLDRSQTETVLPKRKIEQTKMAIEALHHNLYCSKVEFIFEGYSTIVNGTRCLFDYKSRDNLKRKIQSEEASEDSLDEKEVLERANNSTPTEEQVEIQSSSMHEGYSIPIFIDGKKIVRRIKKMRVKRLMKLDGTQASIPIQTFLPFTSDEPQNTSCTVLD